MIDLGANPKIRKVNGETEADRFDLYNFKNVPSVKSAFFPIKSFPTGNLGNPWYYTTGVYDGKFERVVGKGGEGTVVQGEWNGQQAAYKFVDMKRLKFIDKHVDAMVDMSERLKEMTEMMSTTGDAILPFEAHFRQEKSYFIK